MSVILSREGERSVRTVLHAAVACPVPSASRWPGPSRLHVTSNTRISPATLSLLESTRAAGCSLPVFSTSKRLRLLHTTNPTQHACLLLATDDEQRRPSSRSRIGLGLSFASLFYHHHHHRPPFAFRFHRVHACPLLARLVLHAGTPTRHAQDLKLHRPGSPWLGEDDALDGLRHVAATSTRHVRHAAAA